MKKVFRITALAVFVLCLPLLFFFRPDRSVDALSGQYANKYSHFLPLEGMQVHYRDEGPLDDALPIVLLHGTASSLHTWDGWVDSLRHTRRCIRFDLPGYGLTGPHPARDYSMDMYVAFTRSLLDSLGVQRCILAGNSLGGSVAWMTALTYPERVAALVLVDPAGAPFTPKLIPAGFQAVRYPALRAVGRWITPRFLVARSTREVYSHPERVTDALVQRHYDLLLRSGNRQALGDRFRNPAPALPYTRLQELQMPVLLMWGADDQLIPPETAAVFHQYLPNDSLVVFPGLGHVPMEEGAAETVQTLKGWLTMVRW
ncbi:MAG: alpha/beta fold hydrolase [Saprospiraceae bacterium]